MNRTTSSLAILIFLSTLAPQSSTWAQGTAFMYQGHLIAGGNPDGGSYDLRFAIYDSLAGGAQVGGAVTNAPTAVSNGLFNVTLDFGAGVFNGNSRWLEISVRSNGSASAYTTLAPRQPISPVPYAIYSENSASLNGQVSTNFAPVSGSTSYVAKSGDTMTGTLNLPANGLVAGGNQLVLSGGNVGFGTTTPASPFHINQTGADGLRFSRNTFAGYFRERFSNNGTEDVLTFDSDTTAQLLTLGRSGNVGIGTTSPGAKLDINGNAQVKGPFPFFALRSDAWTDFAFIQANVDVNNAANGDYLAFTAPRGKGFDFFQSEVGSKMVITPSGNVGIGATSPSERLEVNGRLLASNPNNPGRGLFLQSAAYAADYSWLIAGSQNVNSGPEFTPSTIVGGATFTTPVVTMMQNGNVGICTGSA